MPNFPVMPIVNVAALLLLALVIVLVVVVHRLSQMLLRPPRMNDGKAMYVLGRMSPGDLGMPFERVCFDIADPAKPNAQLRIAGWWIAAATPSSRTCVLIHGFADAKVGALAWAPLWRELGWNLLLIDLRAHGESGGTYCTGGFYERDDLDAVLNQLPSRFPGRAQKLALFGISLGGAVALATAARREDVDAVIADSVFADYRDAALTHGRLIGAPLPSITPLAIRWAERTANARFDDVRPIQTIGACRCPIMLIHGEADAFVPQADVERLAACLNARANPHDFHLRFENAGHCLAIVADAATYKERLRSFIECASREISVPGGASSRA